MKKIAAFLLALGIIGGTSVAANAQFYGNRYYTNTNPWLRNNSFNRMYINRDRDRGFFRNRFFNRVYGNNGLHRGWYRNGLWR